MERGIVSVNLFKTTVFRLAITFSAIFGAISVITLLSVYFMTIHEIEAQTEMELIHEINDLENVYSEDGVAALIERVRRRDDYGEHLRHFYAFADRGQKLLSGSEFLITLEGSIEFTRNGITFFTHGSFGGVDGNSTSVRYAVKALPDGSKIFVAQAQDSLDELREHTFTALLYAVMITVFLAVFVGAYMGRVVLSHIQRIDAGMENAINTDFKENLPVPVKYDEFQALTVKLNAMLARIESLIQGMRQVTDNIAHDLRSPLNRLRSRLEVTLLQQRETDEYKQVMEKAVADCDQLLRTFNSLLSIAQLESGVSRDKKEPIDLANLADELAELYEVVAEEKGLEFVWRKPEPICIFGVRQSLAQAINNLLENAIKYTPSGGRIELLVRQVGNEAIVTVNDTGSGIPAEFREKALQRFQRLDSSRTESGSGLGLSLVSAVAKLHNAKLVLDDNAPGLSVKLIFSLCSCPST